MEIGFYLILCPIILLLIPTDRFVEIDPYFFMILIIFMALTHYIFSKYNPLTYFIDGDKHKTAAVIAVTMIIATIISQIEIQDIRQFNRVTNYPSRTISMKVRAVWVFYIIDLSFTMMVALVMELVKQSKAKQDIEAERNRAEISLYKSQINPHFMLNMLNTLYGLYITKSDQTGDVFLKFSDMIKYTLSTSEKDKVLVCDEVRYLQEYIDLHSLRLGNQTTVSFDCEIDDNSQMIPPMILISFVENAFKYGVSSSHKSHINISLKHKGRTFIFQTENSIFANHHTSTGIGIINSQKRLELYYPEAHTLEYGIDMATNQYKTYLKIIL
ncbi:MAG: sensor histidine kinase [Rikenellaceae bacterium]